MILDQQSQLIAAGVDGELPPLEARRLERLLAESSEARALFARLETDRARLANLPTNQPPTGLLERILAKLSVLPPHTPPIVEPASGQDLFDAPRRRRWIPVATAAAVYLVLSVGSLLYFTRGDNQSTKRSGGSVVKGGTISAPFLPPDDQLPSTPGLPATVENDNLRVDRTPTIAPEMGPNRPDNLSPQPAPNPKLFAFPPLPPIAPFDAIQVRVPFLASVMELDREDIRQQFVDELGRDASFRIDVFTHDTSRAAEAVQNAAKTQGLNVFVDAAALDRVKRKLPGAFVLYTDSLTPTELRDLFSKLATDDAKSPQRMFDAIHATPVGTTDQNEAKSVFGTAFDLTTGKRSQPTPMIVPDSKPISAGTADQLARTLNKQLDKSAVLMCLSPYRTPPAISKELAQFRDRRGDRRPNTVPVMIVIRVTSG